LLDFSIYRSVDGVINSPSDDLSRCNAYQPFVCCISIAKKRLAASGMGLRGAANFYAARLPGWEDIIDDKGYRGLLSLTGLEVGFAGIQFL